MNFIPKFDGSLPFTGSHPKAQSHVESVTTKAPADAIVVQDANLLFNGDFKRSGTDLVISKDDHELVLSDYFKGEKHAALASPDGAFLTGKIVDALTGHVEVAQADGSAGTAKIIGHVTKLNGNATVIRNGVSIILNNGDNVHQGDVVQCGSNSSLGITFIDGSVFGLGSNAKMVLNEMIYDPNGSNNSSLMSLVAGTITFVAGATAKHGDMKVDTPVATMGIRGTACFVEIDFDVMQVQPNPIGPQLALAPPVKFQVLVEPDGTTGSYVLLDKVTLAPIATISQAGTVTTVSGQGSVSFLASAQLSPEAMKLINEVFSQKFTDNTNPKSDTHFTDTPIPQTTFPVKLASGDTGTVTVHVNTAQDKSGGPTSGPPGSLDHIAGKPKVYAESAALSERLLLTGSSLIDTTSGKIGYEDVNAGDIPTAKTEFTSFTYKNAGQADVTATLTQAQRDAIADVSVPLVVVQDPAQKNIGAATWTYNVQDHALDFLAEGETLTLTYTALVDNNFAPSNETGNATFTITITGTNDTPTIASTPQIAAIKEIADPQTHGSATPDTATGKVEFRDADLTDTHAASITGVAASGTTSGLQAALSDTTVLDWLSLGAFTDSTDGVTGSSAWSFSAQDHYFDYLAESETVTLTYTVEVDDHHGGTATQDVVVTVTGSNDAPELSTDVSGTNGLHPITEQPNVTNDTSHNDTAVGSLTFRDLDLSDTHTVTKSGPAFNWLDSHGNAMNLTVAQTNALNALAAASTFTPTLNDSTGTGHGSISFSYSALDNNFDFLADGEKLTITYEITVTDEHHVSSTQPVTITVTGTNDAPVAHADTDTGHIVEAGHDAADNVVPGVAETTGNVLANDTDVDLTDTHEVVGVAVGTVTGDLSTGVSTEIKGTYGTLVLNANGTWTYTLDNGDPDTNALAQGIPASDVFSYTESDHHGGTSTTTLTINITGTNDEPVTNAAPVAATDVNEGTPVSEQGVNPGNTAFTGVDTATGNVLANDYDVDTGDAKTVQGVAGGTPGGPLTGQVGEVVYGTFGHVIIAADGSWTYTLDNDNAATQALTQDEHATDVFTYTMHDTLGSTSSATLTIDVTGTNDAPVASPDAFTLTSATISLASNVLGNDTDADHDVLSVSGVTGAPSGGGSYVVEGTYGELTISADGSFAYVMGYQLDQGDPVHAAQAAAYYALADGTTADDVFTYTASDGHATADTTLTLTVSSQGSTLAIGTDAFTVTELGNGVTQVSGLYVTDTDATAPTDTFHVTAEADAAGQGGGVTLDEDTGSLADINATLANGITYDPGSPQPDTDMVTLTVEDGHGHSDTVHFIFNENGQGPNVVLSGTDGKDVIFATGHNDTLTGGAGADQFVFSEIGGADTITDFTVGTDSIRFDHTIFADAAAVLAATHDDGNGNTVITIDASNSITLHNVTQSQLAAHQSDFHIV